MLLTFWFVFLVIFVVVLFAIVVQIYYKLAFCARKIVEKCKLLAK